MECRSRITKGLSMLLMASVVSTSVLAGAVAVRAEDSSQNESKAAPSPYVLWYDTPAPDTDAGWENLTLPIGNGYLGARIFGGIETEKIQPMTVEGAVEIDVRYSAEAQAWKAMAASNAERIGETVVRYHGKDDKEAYLAFVTGTALAGTFGDDAALYKFK